MVSCLGSFISLIWNARIKYVCYALPDQPFHMAVSQLGRIAFRFAGNGFNAQLVKLSGGLGREDCPEAQFFKKYGPKWVVFIKIQHSWNAYGSPLCHIGSQRLIVKHPVVFVVKQVRDIGFLFGVSQPSFTAVSCNELASSVKAVDGQDTVCLLYTSRCV